MFQEASYILCSCLHLTIEDMCVCPEFSYCAVFVANEIRCLLMAQAGVEFEPVCCRNQGSHMVCQSEKSFESRFSFSINSSQMFSFCSSRYLSRKANKRKHTRWIVRLVTQFPTWSRASLKPVIILEGENSLLEYFLWHRSFKSPLGLDFKSVTAVVLQSSCLFPSWQKIQFKSSVKLIIDWPL